MARAAAKKSKTVKTDKRNSSNAQSEDMIRKTLADQIAEKLGWEIVFRQIPPGARIREIALATRFNVSRPLMRSVIQRLEVQGLVETVPWKGASVPVLSVTQLSDLYEFSALVFGFVCRLAAQRATEEQLSKLSVSVGNLGRLAKSNCTAEEYERERTATHMLLETCLGEANELMERRPIVRRIRHQFSIDSVRTSELRRASAQRWKTLLSYLKARDAAAAEAHACDMILSTRDAALKAHGELQAATA